jgi:hypothetical protein
MAHRKRSIFRLWAGVCLVAVLGLWLSAMSPAGAAAQGVSVFGKSAQPSVSEAVPQRWGDPLEQRPGRDSGFGSSLACLTGFCALALSAGLLAVFIAFVGRQRKPASGSVEVLAAPKSSRPLPPAQPAPAPPAAVLTAPKAVQAPLPPAAAKAPTAPSAPSPAPAVPAQPAAASRPAATPPPAAVPSAPPAAVSPAPPTPPEAQPVPAQPPAATPPALAEAPVETPAASAPASQPGVPGAHACPTCGEPVPRDNLYCRNCGTRQA